MKTVQVILDFLVTIASLFFHVRHTRKPCKPVVDGSGHPVCLPPQHGGCAGGGGGDTLAVPNNSSPTPLNLLGWALIVSAAGGYLLRVL